MELAINNQTDRFSLAIDAIDRIPKLQRIGGHAKEEFRDRQIACRQHAYGYGIDSPEIGGWKWPYEKK
jgi:xylulose-5-phosphate/fructose-6-phosphate phosphoketolase